MANSTTNLDLISQSQAQKEATANALFDPTSQSMVYGRRASTCTGLTWGYYGGNVLIGGVVTVVANGTLTLGASATNYVQANPSTGAVSSNTVAFTAAYVQLYTVVTGPSTVTSYTDLRTCAAGFGNSAPLPPTFTSGSVMFAGPSGAFAQDNAQFFWDNTNFILNIGNNVSPTTVTDLLAVGTPALTSATSRRAIRIVAGGYAAPGAQNVDSNGDKIILMQGHTNDTIDARIGVDSNNLWLKSYGVSPVGTLTLYVGNNANPHVFSQTGLALGGATQSAWLTLPAGTPSPSQSPLKFTSGTVLSSPEAGTHEYNGYHYLGHQYGRVGVTGSMFAHYVDAGNTTTTETDLFTDTVPANLTRAGGTAVMAKYGGIFVNSASTKQLRAYYGGVLIFDSGALTASAAGTWSLELLLIVTSALLQPRCLATFVATGMSVSSATTYTAPGGQDTSTGLILKITGTAAGGAAATNDIVAKLGKVSFAP